VTRYYSLGAVAVCALVLWALVAWVLGPRGRRDGVLYAGGVVLAGFAVGGAVGLARGERGAFGYLALALLIGWQLRGRWLTRARSSLTPPAV
jgi:hypothetical protein